MTEFSGVLRVPPPMEEGDDQPAAEVSKDKGFRIPHFSPGAPRADPRVAMRSSVAPRTPPNPIRNRGGTGSVSANLASLPVAPSNRRLEPKRASRLPFGGEGRSRRLAGRRRG